MAIREGKWKCPSCNTVNRGAHSQCGQCGTTRDANVKFFLDESDAPVVTDAGQLAAAQAGADWTCEFCSNTNKQGVTTCAGCGAPKSEKQRKHGDVIPVGGPPVAKPVHQAPPPVPAQPGPKSSCGPAALGVAAIAVLLLLGCCVGAMFWARTKTGSATVASATWKRAVDIQDFLPTKEEAWDSAPQGARDITHRREQRGTKDEVHGTKTVTETEKYQSGTRKVKTGDKDLGNGHFEEQFREEPVYSERQVSKQVPNVVQVPVYAERYYYTIDRWRVVRTEKAHGAAPEAPAWPAPKLTGQQKEGEKRELYLVTFTSPEAGQKTLKCSQAVWERFKPGSSWALNYSNAGEFAPLEPGGGPVQGLSAPASGETIP